MSKFQFGTTKHQTLPFVLAGLTFFSRPLTVAEELPLAELGDQFDSVVATPDETRQFFAGQCDIVAGMLRSRLAPVGEGAALPLVDANWVALNMGLANMPTVLEFLRSGKRPSEPLDLSNWTNETIEIDGLTFAMRQMNFAELLLGIDLDLSTGARSVVEGSANMLAALLNNRLLWEGENRPEITADWIAQHLTSADMSAVQTLLSAGPDALGQESEAEDPNAPLVAEATNF